MRSGYPATNTSTRLHVKYLALMGQIDAYIDANLGSPLYNDACAVVLGMSPRSLSNVVHDVHGMSMQRYIRTKRLSAVRSALQKYGQACQIGTVARAHGFEHLGEFAHAYKKLFGELPSETSLKAPPPCAEVGDDDAVSLQPAA